MNYISGHSGVAKVQDELHHLLHYTPPTVTPWVPWRLQGAFIRAVGAILPRAAVQDQRRYLRQRRQLNRDLNLAARKRFVQRLKTLKVNDCRARQARRRALKDQLPALFRAHGFYRPEIVRHVLSYVGFDLPVAEAAALLCACSSYQDWPYTRAP